MNGNIRNAKKVLPNKKFPELKLMINGEYRNSNNTLSSDDDANLAVSPLLSIFSFLLLKRYLQFKEAQLFQ